MHKRNMKEKEKIKRETEKFLPHIQKPRVFCEWHVIFKNLIKVIFLHDKNTYAYEQICNTYIWFSKAKGP